MAGLLRTGSVNWRRLPFYTDDRVVRPDYLYTLDDFGRADAALQHVTSSCVDICPAYARHAGYECV